MLTKKDLEHLGELARIEIPASDAEELLADLEKILAHFDELKGVKTDHVTPVSGGTLEKNILRGDDEKGDCPPRGRAIGQFPEKEGGFLKIPPVFE